MNRRLNVGALVAAIAPLVTVLIVCAPAMAQRNPTRMGGLTVSLLAGGAANSDLQRSEARAEWLAGGGEQSQLFARHLTAETSMAVSVAVSYWFTPYWGVRAQAGVAPTRLEIAVSERETHGIPLDTLVTGPARYGSLQVWTYDAALLFRAPFTPRGRVAVYGFLGGGVVRFDPSASEGLPPEAEPTFGQGDTAAEVAALVGLGALVPLHRNRLSFSIEVTDHISRTPVERAPDSVVVGGKVRVTASSAEPTSDPVTLTSHVRLLLGLTWSQR